MQHGDVRIPAPAPFAGGRLGSLAAGAPRYLLRVAAYAVAANVAASLLGVVYLIVAGRLLAPTAIGTGFAATSLVALAGNLSLLGFATTLIRYRSRLGDRYRDAAISTLWIALPLSVAVSASIWLTLGHGTALAAVPWWVVALLVIPAVVAGWVDAASIAAGDPRAVLIRNAVTGLVRLGLLVALVRSDIDIVWTTCLALAVSVAMVLPRRRELRPGGAGGRLRLALPHAELVIYSLRQFVVTLAFNAPTYLATVVVLAIQDAAHAGWFGLVWGIGFMLSSLGDAAAQGLLAHGSREESQLATLHRKSLLYVGGPLVVAALIGWLLAPLLRIAYGQALPDYAITNFALICLAAVPYVVVTTTVGRYRVTSQSLLALVIAALSGLGTIALVGPLNSIVGETSPGWAYLLANVGAAIVAMAALRLISPKAPASAAAGAPQPPDLTDQEGSIR